MSVSIRGIAYVLAGCCCFTVALSASLRRVSAQDAASRAPYQAIAKEFEFTTTQKKAATVEFQETSLLTYTNPQRGRDQTGEIYLWTNDGSPVVIASLWSVRGQDNKPRRLYVEMHSLSPTPITSTIPNLANARRPFPDWNPPTPSIDWKPIGEKHRRVSPGMTRTLLRRAAAEISAVVKDKQTGKPEPLRLLSSPIYQYETDEVIGGAIFSFVLATDPEVFLLMEARREESGVQLYCAFARMTGRPLEVFSGDKSIWSVESADVWVGNSAYLFCPNAAPMP